MGEPTPASRSHPSGFNRTLRGVAPSAHRGRGGRGCLRGVPGRCRRSGQSGDGPGGAGGALRRDGRAELDGQHELEERRTAGRVARGDNAPGSGLGNRPPRQRLDGFDSERLGCLDERPVAVLVVERVDRRDSRGAWQLGEPRVADPLAEPVDGRDSSLPWGIWPTWSGWPSRRTS